MYKLTCILAGIRKTCPCNEYSRKPHFYIVKLGFAGVYLFFLFLLQNIDCGYSLEPPRQISFFFFSAEKFQFLKLKKSPSIAWASFRNGIIQVVHEHEGFVFRLLIMQIPYFLHR